MSLNMKTYLSSLIGIGIVLLGVGAFFLLSQNTDAQLDAYAVEIVEACADAKYKPSCYDEEIPKVMDKGVSLEDAFAITQRVQEKDASYWYCHVLGHNVSAKEAAKDISQWTDVVARCPQGVCSNGCLHGAFQERFRGEEVSEAELEELIPEIARICVTGETRNFTGLEQASCYHAVGHLTMYITNADIERATHVCDRVAHYDDRDFRNLCYDGAYMQIFQPLEAEDIALVKDIAPETQTDAEIFCNQFTGMRRTACHMESWPLFIEDITTDPQYVDTFCGKHTNARDTSRCYNGIFYVLAARSGFSPESIDALCLQLDGTTQARCYAHSASRFLETDYRLASQATSVCERAEAQGVGEQCYEELLFYSAYNYHKDSPTFIELCEALPGEWSQRCLAHEGARMTAPFY